MPRTSANGINLYCETYDFTPHWQPARTPVLFIHGLGVDHTIWPNQIAPFATRRPVITVDTRGHGRSDKPEGGDYRIETHADDLSTLVRQLGYSRAHIVGTSMGGLIAQQIAIRQPGLVRGLVLIGTFCSPPGNADLEGRLRLFDESPDLATLYRPIVEASLGPNSSAEAFDLIFDLEVNNPRAVLRAGNITTFTYDGCAANRGITAPTLVLVGAHDRYTSDELVASIPGARFQKIAEAGHAPYLETPDEFNRVILDFLDEVELQ